MLIGLLWLFIFKEDWNFYRDLEEFKGFMLIIPSFILIRRVFQNPSTLDGVLKTYIYAMAFTAALGLLEYYLPSVALSLPGFSVRTEPLADWELNASQNFIRATYTFWGAPTVGHIMVFAIPIFWLKGVREQLGGKWWIRFLFFLIVLGIYITGNRANWVHLLIFGIFYITLYTPISGGVGRFVKGISALFVVVLLALQFLPQATIDRLITAFIAVQGEADIARDSSGYARNVRYDNALQSIFDHPFGVGWGGSGWVHADLLQLTANLGWIAGILFLSLLLGPFIKGGLKVLSFPENSPYRQQLVVFLSIQAVILLNFWRNGIYSLPQTGVYYFIFWAMLYYFLRVNPKSYKHGSNRIGSDLQQ